MAGGFNAVAMKGLDEYKVQTESGGFQVPFFMGGSQVPVALNLHPAEFSGSGLSLKTTNPSEMKPRKLSIPFIR